MFHQFQQKSTKKTGSSEAVFISAAELHMIFTAAFSSSG